MQPKYDLKKVILSKITEDVTLYAFVDAARDLGLVQIIEYFLKYETDILFQGENAEFTAHVSPHLFPVPKDSEFLDLWSERRGTSAGILMVSDVETEDLLDHLQNIFHVTDENDDEYLFRYYDPRVIRPYLPTCSNDQLKAFFGPVRAFLVESEKPDEILVYTLETGTLSVENFSLTPFDPKTKFIPQHSH